MALQFYDFFSILLQYSFTCSGCGLTKGTLKVIGSFSYIISVVLAQITNQVSVYLLRHVTTRHALSEGSSLRKVNVC